MVQRIKTIRKACRFCKSEFTTTTDLSVSLCQSCLSDDELFEKMGYVKTKHKPWSFLPKDDSASDIIGIGYITIFAIVVWCFVTMFQTICEFFF